jgi:hypothetical protein
MGSGRITELNPFLQQEVVSYLLKGSSLSSAAAKASIPRRTFFLWLQRGRAGEQPYADFLEAVEEARQRGIATVEDVLQVIIRKSVETENPLAALAFLARRDPKNWGRGRETLTETPDECASDEQAGLEELAEKRLKDAVLRGDAPAAQGFLAVLEKLNPQKWKKAADAPEPGEKTIFVIPAPNPNL